MGADLPPNHAYFRAVQGRFCAPFAFEISDWPAFRACSMGVLDRLRVLSMLFMARIFGPLRLDTSVAYGGDRERASVVHTTRLSMFGMTFFRSVEQLTLHENGRALTMAGEQRLWPAFFLVRRFEGAGEVDATGTRARYEFPFFGTRMRQSTELNGDSVRLSQETPWSRGLQPLARVRGSEGKDLASP